MSDLQTLVKRYPVSSLLVVSIWIICLVPIPEDVPLGDVPMMDKWTHFVMYGVLCTVVWWEYLRRHRQKNASKLFLLAFLAPIVMSGLIELAQAHLTGGNRSGDWFDFLANSIGVVLGNVIGILLAAFRAKGRRDT
jgi:VanZ family protein